MIVRFTIPGEPYGKGRPRFTKTGRVYTPKKTADYERLIQREYAAQTGAKKLEGPIEATVEAMCSVPKSGTKRDRERKLAGYLLPTKKPDCDNIAKTVLDALNGIAYHDDSQVVGLHVYKQYAEIPETRITLKSMVSESEENQQQVQMSM